LGISLTLTAGNNVELEPLTPNGAQFGGGNQLDSPRAILEECREIDRTLDEIEQSKFTILQTMQTSVLNNPDPGRDAIAQLDAQSAEIMNTYRGLVDRARKLKSKPGSSGNPQVGRIDRRVKASLQKYQKMDVEYTKRLQEQMARQYRIVRPDASEQEVRQAVETPDNQQVFSQALMQSNRRGQAQSVMSAVQSRHDEIQKIERQMIELAELFQDMERLVVEQEAAVTNIEMKGEEVVVNMDKGNEQLTSGIKSARNARKWKWWCLGITGKFYLFQHLL
jgi:syntaxin 1B/2/3